MTILCSILSGFRVLKEEIVKAVVDIKQLLHLIHGVVRVLHGAPMPG